MEDMVRNNNLDLGFWKGRKVLVTGHTGFKGTWLTLYLSRLGADISGFSLNPKPVDGPFPNLYDSLGLDEELGRKSFIGDIRDKSLLDQIITIANPDIIIHMAAQSLVRDSYLDPINTWNTNVIGSLNLLQSVKEIKKPVAVILVATDKVYENKESLCGYVESDRLGGHDPYSASKAAMEIAVSSWRASFCGHLEHQTKHLAIATARAGNVIGGGDVSVDRLIPDIVKAISINKKVEVRNPNSVRPWQHVIEALNGYLLLAEYLHKHQLNSSNQINPYSIPFNFGPNNESCKTVSSLVQLFLKYWPGDYIEKSESGDLHESRLLYLNSEQSRRLLNWKTHWDFATTVKRTSLWYKQVFEGRSAFDCCYDDLDSYLNINS